MFFIVRARRQSLKEFASRAHAKVPTTTHSSSWAFAKIPAHTIDTLHRRAMFRRAPANCRSKPKRGQAQHHPAFCGISRILVENLCRHRHATAGSLALPAREVFNH